jgi:hypothetical protein
MGAFKSRALADLSGTGQNAAVDVSDLETCAMWVSGTFVGTLQMQISADGSSWVNEGSPVTAAAKIDIPATAHYVRGDCTAHTSGDIVMNITGIDEDRLG